MSTTTNPDDFVPLTSAFQQDPPEGTPDKPLHIVYIAKHGNGGNDEEGAIAHALRELGHYVTPIQEARACRAPIAKADMLLFHKWYDPRMLACIKYPKVFWYFDLVQFPDPSIKDRCEQRINWMNRVMPLTDVCFCTDGEWAYKHRGRVFWLPQGVDERVMGKGKRNGSGCDSCGTKWGDVPILFTGISRGGGIIRESFVKEMKDTYGDRFRHVPTGIHGRNLADLIASSQLVVAPDGPVSDRYWSNRVYLTLGFGGMILHPYCEGLTHHYQHGEGVVYYKDRKDLHELIEYYLGPLSNAPQLIAEAGYKKTLLRHTYRDRCSAMIAKVRGRLRI